MTSLNILARKHGTPASVQVGAHKLFPANAQHTDLHHGLHARRGYFNSMRPVERNVVLNMHGVTAAFINEQPLHHYPQAFLPKFSGYLADAQFRACDGAFKAIIRGLRVRRLYTPLILTGASRSRILVQPDLSSKIMRITGFGSSAASQTFHHSDYGLISVKNYFNGHVLATTSPLKHPHLLVCNLGTFDRPNFVPSELLYIVADQPFLGQLPEGAMGPMVKVSQRLPKENVELIDDAFKDGSIFSRGDLLENGIKVGEKMMEPKARVLPIPDLMYGSSYRLRGGKQKSTLRNGKWDLRGKRFRVSGSMGMLGIIEVGNTPGRSTTPTYEKFAKDLTGYGISGTHSINVVQAQTSAPAILDTALASMKQRLAFNLVMLPGNDSFTYDAIKWWGDTQAGVHTISITPEKATKLGDAGIRANLVSKFNIKAGGHNHVHIEEAIREMQHGGTTIVLGADVSHPDSSSVQHCPSIAAVVSSVDKFAVNFPGSLRLQIAKQEKITDLKEMVRERITVWLLHNDNKLPTNVIFYRDGVSESQMTMVRDHDLAEIRAAFHAEGIKAGDATYDPKITLIVCGKRHHTRFYPTEKAKKANGWVSAIPWLARLVRNTDFLQAIDNNGNWLAGLVVDDPTIRNPYHYDFYLQSHVALKGTARPCHYFVVHNDMELTSDEIQRITFNLCWTYPISLTPISYASPAYCADVLAERGRSYLTPFIKGGHPVRTSIDANLMEGIQQKLPTKEKDERVLEKIKAGWTPPDFPNMPHWVSVATRSNPQHPDLGETMFYV